MSHLKVRSPGRCRVLAALLLAATLPLACASTAAVAADMAAKAPATPVYQWGGCYAGINGGGGASASNFTTTVDPGTYLDRDQCRDGEH